LNTNLKVCSKCIYDERVPYITFDENGVCNYCHQLEDLKKEYKTTTKEGEENFLRIIEKIKKDGKGKKYDCIIGVSGGTDSSYMLYLTKKWGLRPLAVHYDNTWNSAIATENICNVSELNLANKEVVLNTNSSFSFSENAVALNKYLLENLFPDVNGNGVLQDCK
jgi:hypothetical protein